MAIAFDSVVVQSAEPIVTTVDDEVVMLSVRAGAYFGLNGVGGEIWNMIAQPRRVDDLCDSLSRDYDVSLETLTRDVIEFLEGLQERGLIHVENDRQHAP